MLPRVILLERSTLAGPELELETQAVSPTGVNPSILSKLANAIRPNVGVC